jgi:hypothetical protein
MSLRETKTELKYEYYKEELKKCYACSEWIEKKIIKHHRNKQIYYFHPFCYLCLMGKNPNYKSLNNSSVLFMTTD